MNNVSKLRNACFAWLTVALLAVVAAACEDDKTSGGDLRLYYPEIERYEGQCRYDNCRHITEPDCAVREAVKNGEIPKQRYESYAANIEEIRGKKKY